MQNPRQNALQNVEIAEKLEAFASGPAIRSLSTRLNEFNLFEAIGMVNQEIRHSAFLAFLLTPRQSHGLGDQFLKAILRVTGYNQAALDAMDLTETWVVREWHNIDILAVNTGNKLVIVIENKIYTGEHSDQLARYRTVVQHHYPGYQLVCLYLTPHGSIASHLDYISISYVTLAQQIEQLVLQTPSHSKALVHETMIHYVRMLRKQILGDDEIKKLCEEIYRQNKTAIDTIMRYVPMRDAQLRERSVLLIENTDGLIVTDIYKNEYVGFVPATWNDLRTQGLLHRIQADPWMKSGQALFFHFSILPNVMEFSLQIRYGTPPEQQRLLDIALMHSPLLTYLNPKPGNKYIGIYQKTILTEAMITSEPLDTLLQELDDWWSNFIATDLPAIEQIFVNSLQQSTT